MQQRALFIQYANPAAYPPIEHATRLLADADWDVLCLGIGGAGGDDLLQMPTRPGIRVRRLPYTPPGWRQKLQYASFLWLTCVTALTRRPTWIYASDPLACLPALLASWLLGFPVVYHEHDSPNAHPRGWFMSLTMRARRTLGQRAEVCVLPNLERGKIFQEAVGRTTPVICVPNYPRLDEIVPPRKCSNSAGLRVYYHGTLVPERVPPTLLKALAALPDDVRLRLVGYETLGSLGFTRRLMHDAERLGIAHRLEIFPAASRSGLRRLSADQHVGLALLPTHSTDVNMEHMVGASNKATDYLATGLALLVTDLPDWRATYVDSGYGLSCDPRSASSIASALQWFMTHRDETMQMGERGRQRLRSEWNYDRVFEPVLEAMSGGKASNIYRSA